MKNTIRAVLLAVVISAMLGCATTQNVTLANLTPTKNIQSVALVAQDDNSADMDGHITKQLQVQGLNVKAPLPAGTRKSDDVDMIVAYADVWRWDVVMYLKTVNINFYDAKSGNMLVTGRWDNSAFHGFKNAGEVVKEVIAEMMAKIKSAQSQEKTSKSN